MDFCGRVLFPGTAGNKLDDPFGILSVLSSLRHDEQTPAAGETDPFGQAEVLAQEEMQKAEEEEQDDGSMMVARYAQRRTKQKRVGVHPNEALKRVLSATDEAWSAQKFRSEFYRAMDSIDRNEYNLYMVFVSLSQITFLMVCHTTKLLEDYLLALALHKKRDRRKREQRAQGTAEIEEKTYAERDDDDDDDEGVE